MKTSENIRKHQKTSFSLISLRNLFSLILAMWFLGSCQENCIPHLLMDWVKEP